MNYQNYFGKRPAFLSLIFIVAGIALSEYLVISSEKLIYLIIISSLTAYFLYRTGNKKTLFMILSFISGFFISYLSDNNSFALNQNKLYPDIQSMFKGEIKDIISENEFSKNTVIEGELYLKDNVNIQKIRLLAKISKRDKKFFTLKPGQSISGKFIISLPEKKVLPVEANMRNYLLLNDLDFLAKANSDEIYISSDNATLSYYRYKIKNTIWKNCSILFPERSKAIAYALISGDQSKIDLNTRENYSLSGTSHVLAVSGLHIGIISFFVLMLCSFFFNKYLKFGIFSFLIILYVYLTGLQPSALRASFMAITIYFLIIQERKIDLLNILSFSIIFLILFKPSLIHSLGFHLSALSVLGIAFFYFPVSDFIFRIFKLENKTNYFVSTISISISASLTVSPLVAYYFNFYTFLSFPANLIVIPLISIGQIFSVLSVALYPLLHYPGLLFANSADFFINSSNIINEFLNQFSFAIIRHESIFTVSMIISLFAIYIIFSKSHKQLIFRLTFVILFSFLISKFNINQTQDIFYPKNETVTIMRKLQDKLTMVYINDRKIVNRPVSDYSLIKFLSSDKDSVILCVTGINSLSICDELKKKRSIKIISLDIEAQRRFNKLLSYDINLCKTINY